MNDTRKGEGLRYPTQARGAIPSFASYDEEAAWWDEHDTGESDIQTELEPVTVRISRPLSENVQVRFDVETDRELERLAQERGMKKATLIRTWIIERLRQQRDQHAS